MNKASLNEEATPPPTSDSWMLNDPYHQNSARASAHDLFEMNRNENAEDSLAENRLETTARFS
jgi:hypothetical protein